MPWHPRSLKSVHSLLSQSVGPKHIHFSSFGIKYARVDLHDVRKSMKAMRWRPFVVASATSSTILLSATPSTSFFHVHVAQQTRRWLIGVPSHQHLDQIPRLKTKAKLSTSCPLSDAGNTTASRNTRKIAVIGGGLAGLSVTIHLLENVASSSPSSLKQQPTTQPTTVSPPLTITVLDQAASAGLGGASAVAGGYVRFFGCTHSPQESVMIKTYLLLLIELLFIQGGLMTTVLITKIAETAPMSVCLYFCPS